MDYTFWLWLAAVPAVLVGQIYLLGRRMSEPEKMIRPLTGGLIPSQAGVIAHYQDWLTSAQLEYRTCFRFGSILAVVYQQGNAPRFFSFYFHRKLTFSMESYLEDLTILDTSTSGNGDLFPRPGAYRQSFPGLSAQEAWQRHIEGEQHLSNKFGYSWVPLQKPCEQLLPEAVRVRMKYNRSQLFWPVRVLCRYFVSPSRVKNKSIVQQFP